MTFQYHFLEDTDQPSMVTFGYFDLTSTDGVTLLANVSSYDYYDVVADGEWSLQVKSAIWGYYYSNLTDTNDAAIIASSYDFIHMPAS